MCAAPLLVAQTPTVIRSTNVPAWGPNVRLQQEVRLGVLDGDRDYELGRVRNVAIASDGHIVVADDAAPALRVYDANGTFVRIIGQNGEGPGEYRTMGGVRTLGNGNIQLWDPRLQRLTTYNITGRLVSTVNVPSGLHAADLFQVDHNGFAYVRASTTIIRPGTPFTPSMMREGWIRLDPAGKVLDTIPIPASVQGGPAYVLSSITGFDRPFSRETVSSMTTRGEILVGDNALYSFELRRAGAPTVRIDRAFTPLAVQPKERAEWQAWSAYFEELSKRPPPANTIVIRPPRVDYSIPRQKPAFKELRSDRDGRVWVRRYVAAVSRPGPVRLADDKRPRREWREPTTYDVFEPSGRFLGSVTLPWDSRFEDASGMNVWLTGTGEEGEEFVARYRIVSGGR